jgi:hypothetical protein
MAKITKACLLRSIAILRERKAQPVVMFGRDYYIVRCPADVAHEVVEIIAKSKRPIRMLIDVAREVL